jgi:hypothetical protein
MEFRHPGFEGAIVTSKIVDIKLKSEEAPEFANTRLSEYSM